MNQPFVFEDELEMRWKLSRRMPKGFIGIDFIEVLPITQPKLGQWGIWDLTLHLLHSGDDSSATLALKIEPRHIEINSLTSIPLDPQRMHLRRTAVAMDGSTLGFRFSLLRDTNTMPSLLRLSLVGLDIVLSMQSSASFSLLTETGLETHKPAKLEPRVMPPMDIDYRSRDYDGLRALMLNQLSTSVPHWQGDTPADLGMTLVETLAYSADRISYFQDAVGTESYLGSARQRISVRRHARLLDYRMGEGCNSRVWIHFEVKADIDLPAKQVLLTKLEHYPLTVLPTQSVALEQAVADKAQIFETLHPAMLYHSHNQLEIFTFDSDYYELPAGATRMLLKGHDGNLSENQPLLLEQVASADGRLSPDHRKRHIVRITGIRKLPPASQTKKIQEHGQRVPIFTEVTWRPEDALPFALAVTMGSGAPLAVVRGNLVLADNGYTQEDTRLAPIPEGVAYRPERDERDLTWWVPYDHVASSLLPAVDALEADPRSAVPHIHLREFNPMEIQVGGVWEARHDLLSSSPYDRHFVVEIDNNRRVKLRFGDGVNGWQPSPGNHFKAYYRTGTGLPGNVGSDTIRHIAVEVDGTSFDSRDIVAVRNPLPAVGGLAYEPLARVRLAAPTAWYTQQRCVTEGDYAQLLQRHHEVIQAVARRVWTGSWYTMFIYVDRAQGKPVDQNFKAWILRYLDPYLLFSDQVTILSPNFVALEIVLRIEIFEGYFPNQVRGRLLEVLGPGLDRDGQMGLFHPDQLSFGQTIDLTTIVGRALQVEGVKQVTREVFRRHGEEGANTLRLGKIEIGPLEIPSVKNDPDAPNLGSISILIKPPSLTAKSESMMDKGK